MQAATEIIGWQKRLSRAFSQVPELLSQLNLQLCDFNDQIDLNQAFRFIVTREFASRMQPGDPNDPLLRQVLPLKSENQTPAGYGTDPLNESVYNPLPGLLHKYKSRVLLTLTTSCPINCRYCFRRHFDYEANQLSHKQLADIVNYIQNRAEINEVILSGGEPLLVKNQRLFEVIRQIESIAQIESLRIHSRMPIVLPQRLDEELVSFLAKLRLSVVMVTHSNHPNEIDNEVAAYAGQLKKNGIWLLNQAVLLKNINDEAEVLKNLSLALFKAGIMPYYLHKLDPVAGAAHFAVPETHILTLYQSLLAELPGYLVPKLVCEIAGKCSKTPIASTSLAGFNQNIFN